MSRPTDRQPYVPPSEDLPPGSFRRGPYVFRDWVTADGSSGFPAEPGRYHLYVSHACPWAQRSVIVRKLKGLEDAVTLSVVDPIRDERGWRFDEEHPDPVNGFAFLSEAYNETDTGFDGRPTVPVLWDREADRIVSNNFHDITIMLDTEFDAHARNDADLYPAELRDEIDEINEVVYRDVNDGVYRCGFAQTQEAYEYAFDRLFARLVELERRLARSRYLVGGRITEADVRLWTTLVRFDAVYYVHFKCNLRRLVDHLNLWGYACDLWQTHGFGETVDFDHIKRHYYMTHSHLNPSRIVPKGPEADWTSPHGREALDRDVTSGARD